MRRLSHSERIVRFWSKVAMGDGCWEWQAFRHRKGYGSFKPLPGSSGYAHRFSWQLHYGPIPEGMSVLHHCDNPPCVRPDHLFLGTPADNMADRDAKGRQARGERSGVAILTPAQVVAIRVRYAVGGVTLRQLGSEYGVTLATVGDIIQGRTWRHVA